MRVNTTLLIVFVTLLAKASAAEDLYLEGEDEANEFLEVDRDTSIGGHLRRLKRDWSWNFLQTSSPDPEETATEDDEQIDADEDNPDSDLNGGSGAEEPELEPEKEKTLRVTFVVMEPYRENYSNRDSAQFQNFSKSLAEAVNTVFRDLSGTHRASLVRIQSRPADEFTCKVTLDIVVTGDDTDRTSETLRDYIRNRRMLGKIIVSDVDYSATVIDSGYVDSEAISQSEYQYNVPERGDEIPETTELPDLLDPNRDNIFGERPRIGVDENETTEEIIPYEGGNDYERPTEDTPLFRPDDGTDHYGRTTEGIPDYGRTTEGRPDDGRYNYGRPTEGRPDEGRPNERRNDRPTVGRPNYGRPTEGRPDYDRPTEGRPNYGRPTEERPDYGRPTEGRPDYGRTTEGRPDYGRPTEGRPNYGRPTEGRPNYGRPTEGRPNYGRPTEGRPDYGRTTEGRPDYGRTTEGGPDYSSPTEGRPDYDRPTEGRPDNRGQGGYESYTEIPGGWRNNTCQDGFMRCDETRCVLLSQRCDDRRDCDDGADEMGCPDKLCDTDDFRCNNGKCIENSRRCDRQVDCPSGEDERNCDCRSDEFRCEDDGSCIENRKRCNGYNECRDGSDELDCACTSDQWQCDYGYCIKRTNRCNGRVDCPTDRSDERNCVAIGYFKCRTGKLIPEKQRCDRNYDCDLGDYSDEQNCPCGDGDFKCDNGYCIPPNKKCDRTHDCQDGSDERDCTYGSVCMAYQYKCSSGQCVSAESRCNETEECLDGSDETNCPCKRGQFYCHDGTCINFSKRCNGQIDCQLLGEDEMNCGSTACGPDSVACDAGSSVPCATKCDGNPECDNGEDEDGCPYECNHKCDGRCLQDDQICDGNLDCTDGSDEVQCNDCDGPNDFRCNSGDCINSAQHCNGEPECDDGSDELNCNVTMISEPYGCLDNQFQCRDGGCVNNQFFCDGHNDCNDNSDEANCPCSEGEWQCVSGQCIPVNGYCDGVVDCTDSSDERDCPTTYRPFTTAYPGYPYPPTTTQRAIFTTTSIPYEGGCGKNEWRCENGPCIDVSRRCDGNIDCSRDGSDEFDCPTGSPYALKLTTYPVEQTVRYGGDVVFSCRDEGPIRASVRWIREGGRPLKPGYTDRKGRLEISGVTPADSGVYICQAPKYLGHPRSQIQVVLTVERSPPTYKPPFIACPPNQATCASGQCISRTAICDGNQDCADGSDEESCHHNGMCEPNEYQCANRKCVLKTWLCDAEDDCGDESDEQNCGQAIPGQQCLPVEFACATNNQCIPKNFHCDKQSDCFDKSDEIGCAPVYVKRPPSPSNLKLNPGDTLTLRCEAVGVPMPLISWRLNWGNVPEKCTSTSSNGTGVLTCPNMQSQDSGAYSCEGMNNRGTIFAAPDAIVYVNRTADVCPPTYFNSEARSESECIRCFCFGKSTQCQSADLFIFNMPTPLGEGGTRLLGVSIGYNGAIQKDEDINNQYYYQPLRNGATVTKLDQYGSLWTRNSQAHPYLTLPESYNGNQLTSYGGSIKYRLSPHTFQPYAERESVPDIIILGKYQDLVHFSRSERTRELYIDAHLTPEYWQKPSSNGLLPASREDIMMTLDAIEMILLRADLNNAGANITEFTMVSAQLLNVGLGAASLVEECECPKGYKGRSCEKCADGYELRDSGPWNGVCVPKAPTCPPMTYGDPNNGGDCRACPCPLTNRGNQFASGCSIGPSGNVVCDCLPGYEGPDCSYCAPNYLGNPLVPGDSCKPKPQDNCDPIGTAQVRAPDECICKENVQGRYCDQCKNGSFFLSNDFKNGCALCFCSGIPPQNCVSSTLRRRTTTVRFNVPTVVDQLKVYNSAPIGPAGAVRYITPVDTGLRPALVRGEVNINSVTRSEPSIFYWGLQDSFAGDKVTSYGGYLTYQLRNVQPNPSYRNTAADVQLVSDNSLTFLYFGKAMPTSDGYLNASVQFIESSEWQRSDGRPVTREHFLLALADVKTILIKATYSSETDIASIDSASIETADEYGDGPMAQHVEQCMCPPGYKGTSCEDCAPGYTRSLSGLYLRHCVPCDCNGHSNKCHPETGECFECNDNTQGPSCEYCRAGYEQDQANNCVPSSPTPRPRNCNCDSRGLEMPCDESGYCICKQNVEGEACDRCRPGTFGLDAGNRLGCTACYCSGVSTDCHEATHYARIILPAPILGENYGGYTLMDIKAERIINDQFVPVVNESQLMYVFSDQPIGELYWSLPVFPGNRVLSYNGTLSLTQEFQVDPNLSGYPQSDGYPDESVPGTDVVLVGESQSIFWSNPTSIRSGEALSYQVPLRENGWLNLNSFEPTSRETFMSVLKNLKRVLVRATLVQKSLMTTSIADVSMETAVVSYDPSSRAAKGIEECMCPEGYTGTSCESCTLGHYKDRSGYCRQCNCNGHDCQLGIYDEIVCNCRPPYTGPDCSTVGLIMELHPHIHEEQSNSSVIGVSFTCKYRAPEPLTIKFYFAGREMVPAKPYTESKLYKDGWRGEHTWRTLWNTEQQEEVYECRTITKNGFLLGILSTTLPEKDAVTDVNESTTRGPIAESSVVVRIRQPKIQIQEVGGTVNFTCQASSRVNRAPLQIEWFKAGGYLPQGRSQVDSRTGLLLITNVQVSDSGTYICQTSDGVSTQQDVASLKVPGNDMTAPTVSVSPSMKEYPEGSRIEITCTATGNPAPRITWQRASNRALPRNSEVYESLLIIENAGVEDSGEYRCMATNPAGSTDRTAVITVRAREPPQIGNLTVSAQSPTLNEGQSTKVVCTGTTDVPAGTLDWVRQDGTQLSSNVKADNGVLQIDVARIENQGVYICQTAAPGVKPVLVVLSVIPRERIAPTITLSASSIKIPTGGRGEVECYLGGDPMPLAKWTKHLGVFGPGTSQRDNTLIITNAQESDLGYYICEGNINGNPVVKHYVYVQIEKREKAQVAIYPQAENSATLGSEFQLNCYVTGGDPPPVVTWNRDGGRALSPSVEILPNNVLKFRNVEVNDEGEYTCTAANSAGSVSASAVLKVRSPPVIRILPDTYIKAYRGESVNVDCRADGYPEPEVSIKTSSDLRVLVAPKPRIASLSIPSLSDSDDGIYLCTASSAAGTIEEQFAIRVERGDASEEPDFGNPTVLRAIERKETRIGCNASNEFYVVWGRADRNTLQPNARQIGNELVIYNTSKIDSGKYECTLINRRTQEVQQSAYTSLQVIAPPKITLRPPTQTVHPGQSPTVECLVEGDDITQIYWRPYNYTSPSSRVEYRGSTLIFRQIEVEDAGQYECIALNSIANASGIAEVIVSEDTDRATSESYDNEQIAHLGAAVHLSCNVSQRNVRIRWTKDGRPVPKTVNQKNDGSLLIRLAQKSDSGRYVCHIRDVYGRQTTNYINLHIEGIECLDTQFHCYDDSGCIDEDLLCDGFNDCLDSSDENNCIQRKKRLSKTLLDPNRIPTGPRDLAETLVTIDQPRRTYRVGERVEVLCRAKSRDVSVKWERFGTNQYVEFRTYGDGALLHIPEVQVLDAGLYRCTGEDRYGLTSYDDFNLEVVPGQARPMYPTSERDTTFTVHLGDIVDLPCNHNLEEPVSYEWKREYTQLPLDMRQNERNLHLNGVTEADAGTYVCRVTNNRAQVETRATLRVIGLVPKFNGDGWVALPSLKDAYLHFDIEISFKPSDQNGVILYNTQNNNGTGDYLILQLINGAPELTLKFDTATIVTVTGDRPLQLNVWHTIRLSRSGSKVTMDVDNTGPFVAELSNPYVVLDLNAPLYIGGAPDQRTTELAQATGFVGCVSMLILGKEEKVIMDNINLVQNVFDCDSCNPNQCLNGGVCQEARNERGYTCLCASGFAGLNCDRPGEACRPGLCGPGKCIDTLDGYKCACPVTFTGKNCDVKQNIDYPAFTGSAYLAIKPPKTSRYLQMSMKVKAKAPVTDGIIMYCAQSPRGHGGFTSLAVRDSRLEFRYDVGDGNAPIILTSNEVLQPNEWTDVRIARVGSVVSLRTDMIHKYEATLASAKDLNLETPMFVGGVDDSIILNNNTGVTGGFSGCIKDVTLHGDQLDLVNDSIQSANVQECDNILRGDIPEMESFCSECRNGGYCLNSDSTTCTCQPGFTGDYCERRAPINRMQGDPCAAQPCQNGGTCRADRSSTLRYSCDCPLGYTGNNCVQRLELLQSVAFEGNGYLALSANNLQYDQISLEPVLIALAFNTRDDGVLLYQNEDKLTYGGDYILLRVDNSVVVVEWDLGGGKNRLSIPILVTDEERHQVIVKLFEDGILDLTVDKDTVVAASSGISNVMNADSNIYIGGIPDHLNTEHNYPGFRGCVEQVEFSGGRSINLRNAAVGGLNTQRCKK